MTISKVTSVDQITVIEDGAVFYREVTRFMEAGEQISQAFHRTVLKPGQDLTGVPANVVAICNAAWTPEVIAAYQTKQDRIAAEMAARTAEAAAAQTTA